ncbi:helix-turn-helix domain-containing protein [Streptococcus uberis]|uniref:helix-turn-helix domain-containing protein n=1 Tax=Streptococcus TaxID=1301 RepID=UPI00020CBE21|nr:helix-turn-helix transcriptional regulator [Streptococcus parauberis]AEF24529.1 hypothetical protein STP_0081 [Streptococcus parauberis KCTC 11537]PIA84767.1 helix-turn-helix protein [Streptococcus parauberis]PNY20884.1 helix-turn-helix protein [Streptococcus parauberis]GAJ62505.1 hypothetical protein SS13_contig00029-0018 [Streptococcus parauberis]
MESHNNELYDYSEALTNFRENMKVKRVEKKLSQRKLASIVGTSLSTIKNYENGSTFPTGDAMVLIASALDMTLDEMVGNNKKIEERLLAGYILEKAETNPYYSNSINNVNLMARLYKIVRFELEKESLSSEDLNLILGGELAISDNEKRNIIKIKLDNDFNSKVNELKESISENLDEFDPIFGYYYREEIKRYSLKELLLDK